ncbi:MAG: MFS transporter [Candidatus Sungiibacteriota bacterium]
MKRIIKMGKRTFSSLKIRNYRLYFFGQAISLSGTWMQTIAQSWLVLKITGSGTALGLITALQFLPILLFGAWGGVIADRFPKRRILFVTQSVSGLLALILGILVATDTVQLWMVGALAFGLGLVNAVDNPTRQTFILEMVEEDHFPNAVSLNSTQVNLARVAGPAIGGVLIATIGLAWCFSVNAISYIAVLAALWLMRSDELFSPPPQAAKKGRLREGFRYVGRTPLVRDILIMMALIGTLSYEFVVILPLFAEFTFQRGAAGYAALMSAMGAGSAAGGLYTAHRKERSGAMLVNAAFSFGIVMLMTAVMPTFALAMAAMALVGFFSINFLSLGNILLQLESKPAMRGRVMALWAVAFLGSTPIGGPIIGWIGENASPRWGLAVGGVAAIAAAGFGAWRFGKDKHPQKI